MPKPYQPKYVFHIRLDSFFASIEESRHPEWVGQPIVVTPTGHTSEGALSLNFPARRLGFRPGQPLADILRLCPIVVQKPIDLTEAKQRSKDFFALLCHYSKNIEPRLLDEAFIEPTESQFANSAPTDFAVSIQRSIATRLGLTASIGIARTKTAAWAASQDKRPNGLTLVPVGYERAFLYPLPLVRLYSLGDRARHFLIKHGITTIGQLATASPDWLESQFGSSGRKIHAQACGNDQTVIESVEASKTVSRSLSFESPIQDPSWITTTTLHIAKKALIAVEAQDRQPGTCTIRLIDNYGRSRQRQHTLKSEISFTIIRDWIQPQIESLLINCNAVRSVEIEFGKFRCQERAQSLALWNGKKIQSALLSLQWRMNGISARLFSPPATADSASNASLPFAVA